MADTKRGRDKKARDSERSQREHELQEALERGDQPEPSPERPASELEGLDDVLESYTYPIRTNDLIEEEGGRTVGTAAGYATLEDLLGPIEDESYDSPDAVRERLIEQLEND